jgi:uncharacterized membrane protein YdjX (TVP38/TMEM64 family)
MRDRLLAEHLGMSVDAVAREAERAGAIGPVIDLRQDADHTLVRIEMPKESAAPPAVLQAAADPDEPAAFGASVESVVPAVDATSVRSPLRLWILPAVVLAAAAAVAWQSSLTLASIPVAPISLWVGIGVFVLAGSMLIPLELLSMAAGVCFGTLRGGLVALIGSLVAAILGYLAGLAIGALRLPRWMSRQSYRSIRQLSARGVMGVIVLRLASVASAGSIHLICGAGRVPFASYMAGTAIGLAPPIVALAGLGGLLRHTFLNPSVSNGLTTIGVAAILFAMASGLRAFLLVRQFAPAVSRHSGQAEFG